ncbi:MAG: hypothetical protein AAB276_01100 [Pseudomonadota bacterium]
MRHTNLGTIRKFKIRFNDHDTNYAPVMAGMYHAEAMHCTTLIVQKPIFILQDDDRVFQISPSADISDYQEKASSLITKMLQHGEFSEQHQQDLANLRNITNCETTRELCHSLWKVQICMFCHFVLT